VTLNRRGTGPVLTALAMALVMVAGALAGCAHQGGNRKGAGVETNLTEAAARERITTYLLETLAALPPGVGLSRTPDNPNLAAFGDEAAITVPCNDSDLVTDGPVQAQIAYWVVGVPTGQTARYFDLIRDVWTRRGWALRPDSDSRWAPVLIPDGYVLTLLDARKGDGSLSITAGSPCFPQSGVGTTTPQPSELKRPS
jgi:hypothetical protein